ncbi:hypothetical protein DPMN_162650 [Dreissena polymorpha]|uniref:Uncharacterized protein n=1 Tax=Dreissena polymorpha TaxID=45954 RepID=A0A9D4IQR3_DREPO|nr:hypothetical protein DPMN_162650 [Dreissena polymorpha]
MLEACLLLPAACCLWSSRFDSDSLFLNPSLLGLFHILPYLPAGSGNLPNFLLMPNLSSFVTKVHAFGRHPQLVFPPLSHKHFCGR